MTDIAWFSCLLWHLVRKGTACKAYPCNW